MTMGDALEDLPEEGIVEDVFHIIHLEQDDPKKCTAKIASQPMQYSIPISKNHPKEVSFRPKSRYLLGPDDKNNIDRGFNSYIRLS